MWSWPWLPNWSNLSQQQMYQSLLSGQSLCCQRYLRSTESCLTMYLSTGIGRKPLRKLWKCGMLRQPWLWHHQSLYSKPMFGPMPFGQCLRSYSYLQGHQSWWLLHLSSWIHRWSNGALYTKTRANPWTGRWVWSRCRLSLRKSLY